MEYLMLGACVLAWFALRAFGLVGRRLSPLFTAASIATWLAAGLRGEECRRLRLPVHPPRHVQP